jgi:hypothetical protein
MRILILLLAALVLATAWAAPVTQKAGKYSVTMILDPSPPTVGSNVLTFLVKDGKNPLKGADVTLHLDMTAMSMPADTTTVPGKHDGEYVTNAGFSMAGTWKLTVSVAAMAGMSMDGDGKATFTVDVKEAASAPAAASPNTTSTTPPMTMAPSTTAPPPPPSETPSATVPPPATAPPVTPGLATPAPPATSEPPEAPASDGKLSTEQLIGIAAGIGAAIVVILMLALRKKKG